MQRLQALLPLPLGGSAAAVADAAAAAATSRARSKKNAGGGFLRLLLDASRNPSVVKQLMKIINMLAAIIDKKHAYGLGFACAWTTK